MKKIFSIFILVLGCHLSFAQNILGKWKTIDDETGNPKAIVNLYMKDGKLYGKIIEILEKGRENAVCSNCDGADKDKLIKGMDIIRGFVQEGEEYEGKFLLDPKKGSVYRGKLWLDKDEPNKLRVRGYIAFLYRTQTWLRVQS